MKGRPGDWNCPHCGDLQFARNNACRKCGEPKPDGSEGLSLYDDEAAPMESYRPMDVDDRRDRGDRGVGKGKGGGGGGMPRGMKEGDWICEQCGDHQFARNDRCRKCGNPSPASQPVSKGMSRGKDRDFGALPRPMPVSVREPAMSPHGGGRHQPDMKPGDWICPECGDLQFARNTECRKCGTPAPGPSADPRDARDTMQSETRPGDWFCQRCGDLQFARNTSCRKCGGPKVEDAPMPEREPPHRSERQGSGGGGGGGREIREGDWGCPRCGDLQFARNTECRKCGEPKPSSGDRFDRMDRMDYRGGGSGGGGGRAAVPVPSPSSLSRAPSTASQDVREGDWMCPGCGEHNFGRNANCRRCSHAQPQASRQQIKDGDWTCPSCGDHVFGRNDRCRKCGTLRDELDASGGDGGPAMFSVFEQRPPSSLSRPAPVSGMKGASKGNAGGRPMEPNDWVCSNCGDVQFSRNSQCRMCGTPKGAAAGGRPPPSESKQQMREGDWHCPNCGDLQFARNEACRKCGTVKPLGYGGGMMHHAGAPGGKGGGDGRGKGRGAAQEIRPGDWRCPECLDLQFARNSTCRKCGCPKPEGEDGGDRGRSRSPFR